MLPSSEGAKYLLSWLLNQGYKDIEKSSSKGAKYLLSRLYNNEKKLSILSSKAFGCIVLLYQFLIGLCFD
jgi:hypothetical protein